MTFVQFLEQFANSFVETGFLYVVFALPFFLVFWVIGKKYFRSIRIQEVERATPHHFKHDLLHSAQTLVLFALMDMYLLYLHKQGYTWLYFDVNQYGWAWLFVSLALLLFLNDTFFYWSHRAMHHPKLYNFFHRVHHESTDPSPLTAFAFHPSEAIVENAMAFVLPFVMPLHFGVVLAWQLLDMLNNVLGHLGYEAYPKGWVKMPILKYKTASTHHNMHHQLFNGNYALYFTWWDKWMGTEFQDYETRHAQIFERKQYPKSDEGLYWLTVSAIRPEANDAYTIEFSPVPTIFQDFSAGQHVTLKVKVQNETLYRTFSLSSVPSTTNSITLTIKRIKGGKVTSYLAENLQVGDTLEVSAPSGQFVVLPEPAHQKHYVMIAGGSGITPIYSMIGTILKFEPNSKITLLYANKTSNSVIFKEKLEKWATDFPTQFEIQYFFSQEENKQERISRLALEKLLNQYDRQRLVFYLCGNEIMTNTLIQDLLYLGVGKAKIHRELFLITTQNQTNPSKTAHIQATIFGKTHQFQTKEGQTILQSALEQNIPLPYSCQNGLCGMCRMQCTAGKVIMQNNQVLSEQSLKAGYILTCQSLPQTEQINIQN